MLFFAWFNFGVRSYSVLKFSCRKVLGGTIPPYQTLARPPLTFPKLPADEFPQMFCIFAGNGELPFSFV